MRLQSSRSVSPPLALRTFHSIWRWQMVWLRASASITVATGAGNLEVSTDDGVTWTDASSATITAGMTSVLARTPIVDDSASEPFGRLYVYGDCD